MEIIGIAGTKQAGKDSAAKLITGIVMQRMKLINNYDMTADGHLIVYYQEEGKNRGTIQEANGIFDLDRRDEVMVNWLSETVWPHVKIYHFADSLKFILANMFNLDLDMLFGDTSKKESPSPIKWERMVDVIPKKKLKKNINLNDFMTYREVMQYFSDILRNIDDDCFTRYCVDDVNRNQVPISIVGDVRREEEVDAIKAAGGKIIYLTRHLNDDTHHMENGLKNVDRSKFDIVIDNQNMSMGEKNVRLVNELKNIGF